MITKTKKYHYENGQRERVITKFLVRPLTINGIRKWLETVKIKQKLTHEPGGDDGFSYAWDESYTWINDVWMI